MNKRRLQNELALRKTAGPASNAPFRSRIRRACLAVELCLVAFPFAWGQAKSQQKADARALLSQYIMATQKKDYKTIIDLTEAYQVEVAQIKANNPQALWPRLIGEYYRQKIDQLSKKPDSWGVSGFWAASGNQLEAFLPVSCKWNVTETRTQRPQGTPDGRVLNELTAYVSVGYASPNEAPLADGKLLKGTILEFTLNQDTQRVLAVGRVKAADAYWDSVPLTILEITWQADMLSADFSLEIGTVGGKPPYSARTQCGALALDRWKPVRERSKPEDPIVRVRFDGRTSSWNPLSGVNPFIPEKQFPLSCVTTVTDGSGQSDAVLFTAQKMLTGVLYQCWVRSPWFEWGQSLGIRPGSCIEPVQGLQIAEAVPVAPDEPAVSKAQPAPNPAALLCPDLDTCLKSSLTALAARRWDESLSYSQAASELAPDRGEPWIMMSGAYFEKGDYGKTWETADKGLAFGSRVQARACRERTLQRCEQGIFVLGRNEVAFINGSNQKVFSAPVNQVTSRPAELYFTRTAAFWWLNVAGKNYRLYLIPDAVQCQIDLAVICPEPGFTQQKVFADYVHHAIQGLVSGTLAKPEASTQPSVAASAQTNPVVSGGTLGQFRHGSLVTKLPSGSLVLAPTPEDATHTHPGVDIVAECGTPIYALADGTVIDVIDSEADADFGVPGKKGLGYIVIVKHSVQINGKDAYAAYFHMGRSPLVQREELVKGGQTQVGVVGMTGAATACHLHLEVRHFGSRYLENPEWNQPWNIYGVGDQRDKPVFLENWADPEKLAVRLY